MSVKAKDVADRMGISVSTIYKAFNGAEDINKETRAAILETSAEMGYTGRPRQAFSKRVCVFMGHMEAPHVTYYLYEVMIAFKWQKTMDTKCSFTVLMRMLLFPTTELWSKAISKDLLCWVLMTVVLFSRNLAKSPTLLFL